MTKYIIVLGTNFDYSIYNLCDTTPDILKYIQEDSCDVIPIKDYYVLVVPTDTKYFTKYSRLATAIAHSPKPVLCESVILRYIDGELLSLSKEDIDYLIKVLDRYKTIASADYNDNY